VTGWRGDAVARSLFGAIVCAAVAGAAGCASFGQHDSTPAGPPAGSDEGQVFRSLQRARQQAQATPPGWVGLLEPLARRGALRLATGGDAGVVAQDIANHAASEFGRNVRTWSFKTDTLTILTWPPSLISSKGLLATVGVALMQTAAAGRYAVVLIMPDAGMGYIPR
jgi:hypothetical protein